MPISIWRYSIKVRNKYWEGVVEVKRKISRIIFCTTDSTSKDVKFKPPNSNGTSRMISEGTYNSEFGKEGRMKRGHDRAFMDHNHRIKIFWNPKGVS